MVADACLCSASGLVVHATFLPFICLKRHAFAQIHCHFREIREGARAHDDEGLVRYYPNYGTVSSGTALVVEPFSGFTPNICREGSCISSWHLVVFHVEPRRGAWPTLPGNILPASSFSATESETPRGGQKTLNCGCGVLKDKVRTSLANV